jgi:histidinol-phosphate/aromatic aminotransferase/cobyric acid decarboxylase-like protein
MPAEPKKISLELASDRDRESIYRIRHQVYARELGQHQENDAGELSDKLDAVNCYLVAKLAGEIVGFISVTPPNELGYSIDKYFSRDELPLIFDQSLYEVRLLTVTRARRGSHLASLLMYAALRYIESLGARTMIAIGRLEILDMYKHAGLRPLGLRIKSGSVNYELLSAETRDLHTHLKEFKGTLADLERLTDWKLKNVNFRKGDACYHGGSFFDAIGDEFDNLEKKNDVINADVLDAWFDPAPSILEKLQDHLAWALRTSPPTASEGLCRVLCRARGVPEECVLPGAGSSDLIFMGLRHWIHPQSRVLILDPMYGEYAHVLEKVIACKVERFSLSASENYTVNLDKLREQLKNVYDWVILVNPNSPTGQHVPREALAALLSAAPKKTRFWVDETYVEYAGNNQSLEQIAAWSSNVVICKSMSKVYALSGVRSAYLCGPAQLLDELRMISPPWALSLPAQIAASEALKARAYYRRCWDETHKFRDALAQGLKKLNWKVLPGCANFLLCEMPEDQPEAAQLVQACQVRNLFIRDVQSMGKCFNKRMLRVAVKDLKTNLAILEILRITLSEIAEASKLSVAA